LLDRQLGREREKLAVGAAPEQCARCPSRLGRELHELSGCTSRSERKCLAGELELSLAPPAGGLATDAQLRGENNPRVRRRRLREWVVVLAERLSEPHQLELADDLVPPQDRNAQDRAVSVGLGSGGMPRSHEFGGGRTRGCPHRPSHEVAAGVVPKPYDGGVSAQCSPDRFGQGLERVRRLPHAAKYGASP
jgi:hypothetical protein